jgi:hypothetical protein
MSERSQGDSQNRRGFLRSLTTVAGIGGGLTLLAATRAEAATGEVTLTPTSSSDNLVTAQSSTVRPLTLHGASGQSASLQQWQASDGTTLSSVDDRGRMKIVADGSGGHDTSNLVLDNRTVGASPAQVATISYKKDGVERWEVGFDQTAGSQGDFDIFHYWHADPSKGRDVLYLTDEAYPKVSINGDRYTDGTFTIYSYADRPTAVVNGAPGQSADLSQWKRAGESGPVFAIGTVGTLRIAHSKYVPRAPDAPTGAGFLSSAAGQLTWLSADGSSTTLGPDPAIADGRNVSFGTSAGTKIGTAATQRLGFFNTTPVAQRSLSYSRSNETPAEAAIRTVLASLGLASDTVGL